MLQLMQMAPRQSSLSLFEVLLFRIHIPFYNLSSFLHTSTLRVDVHYSYSITISLRIDFILAVDSIGEPFEPGMTSNRD